MSTHRRSRVKAKLRMAVYGPDGEFLRDASGGFRNSVNSGSSGSLDDLTLNDRYVIVHADDEPIGMFWVNDPKVDIVVGPFEWSPTR
jgi:hypothetical protein